LPQVALRIRESVRFRLARYAEAATQRQHLDALAACGLSHAPSIHTYTSPEELSALYHLAHSLPPAAAVVEVGTFLGASTCYLVAAVRPSGGRVTCIDTWQNDAMVIEDRRETWDEFRSNLRPAWDSIDVIQRSTASISSEELPADIHLAFIDGDHSYEGVNRDFRLVSPRLGPGGLVAFHDVGSHRGVTRFVGELIASCNWKPVGHVGTLMWLRRAKDLSQSMEE
jgi:predicted O-methyltransferase YrrM